MSSVTGSTDLLVTGENVGATKMTKAESLGVVIVPWPAVMNGSGPKPRPPRPSRKKKGSGPSRPAPRQVAPMLAKASDELPAGDGWLFEIKWDGYRCIATVEGHAVSMQSRSGKSEYAEQFPEVAEALAAFPHDCVLDGEIVSSLGGFEAMGTGAHRFVVFDLLEYRDADARALRLVERRELLEQMLPPGSFGSTATIVLSPAWTRSDQVAELVREHELEGIVAKRENSRYVEGSRAGEWTKWKRRPQQEFVVVGYTPGEGARSGMIGALLLAVNDEQGGLDYVGRCGTGRVTDGEWEELRERLTHGDETVYGHEGLWLDTHDAPNAELRDVVWVLPVVVVQVAFQRWTKDGRLWHPSYLGVREDKAAGDVGREGARA